MAKEKDKGGRPRKEIDFVMLDKYLSYGHTGEECADLLSVDYDTLNTRIKEKFNIGFSEYFKSKNVKFKSSLRSSQLRIALGIPHYLMSKNSYVLDEKGNRIQDGWLLKPSSGMNIWLGKNYLSQKGEDMPNQDTPTIPEFDNWENNELEKYVKQTTVN